MKNRKIGYALGGGGARGVAHIGVLKILESIKLQPEFLAGSSFGAVIAASLALGMTTEEIETEVISKRKRDIFRMIDFSRPRRSILKGDKLTTYLNEVFQDKSFSDIIIPLVIVATDLNSGKEVLIKKGKIVDALKASIAVPGIFPPVKIDDKLLVDGGVANPTPVDVVKKMGADKVIGVDLMMRHKEFLKEPNILKTLLHSYEIIRNQVVEYKIKEAEDYAIVIRPRLKGSVDSFKFHDLTTFMKAGEEAAKEKIKEIKNMLK